jgi:adenosylcobyric acid synthase
METALELQKQLRRTHGRLAWTDAAVSGYEIHCGISHGAALACPSSVLDDGRSDGALSPDGQILGSYLHGLFDQPQALSALLAWAGLRDAATVDVHALREESIDRLADAVENHLDTAALLGLIGMGEPSCAH